MTADLVWAAEQLTGRTARMTRLRTGGVRLTIDTDDELTPRRMRVIVGGHVMGTPNGWRWSAGTTDAVRILTALLPHMPNGPRARKAVDLIAEYTDDTADL